MDDLISIGFQFPGTQSNSDKTERLAERHAAQTIPVGLVGRRCRQGHCALLGGPSSRSTAACGAREICQLYVSDIKEVGSIIYFDLTETVRAAPQDD